MFNLIILPFSVIEVEGDVLVCIGEMGSGSKQPLMCSDYNFTPQLGAGGSTKAPCILEKPLR